MLPTPPSTLMSLGPRGWKSKTEGSLLCLGLVFRFSLPGVFLFLPNCLFSLVISNILTTKGNISIGGVLVPLELKSKEPDGDRIVYTGTYDTEGVAPTKSGERQPIQITMPFTDIGTFETVWQVKFYNYHKRDHCQWGSPFSVIEYECKPNETRSLMWVNKESFL
ncbi:CB1 cannabinoid receptor-interacting protein 1 isoform 2-T2 [Megaptera novaeangliae]